MCLVTISFCVVCDSLVQALSWLVLCCVAFILTFSYHTDSHLNVHIKDKTVSRVSLSLHNPDIINSNILSGLG